MRVQPITIELLISRYGLSPSYWRQERRRLGKEGILHKRGAIYWGCTDRLEAYLATGEDPRKDQ